jgi:hypothetical protein
MPLPNWARVLRGVLLLAVAPLAAAAGLALIVVIMLLPSQLIKHPSVVSPPGEVQVPMDMRFEPSIEVLIPGPPAPEVTTTVPSVTATVPTARS